MMMMERGTNLSVDLMVSLLGMICGVKPYEERVFDMMELVLSVSSMMRMFILYGGC